MFAFSRHVPVPAACVLLSSHLCLLLCGDVGTCRLRWLKCRKLLLHCCSFHASRSRPSVREAPPKRQAAAKMAASDEDMTGISNLGSLNLRDLADSTLTSGRKAEQGDVCRSVTEAGATTDAGEGRIDSAGAGADASEGNGGNLQGAPRSAREGDDAMTRQREGVGTLNDLIYVAELSPLHVQRLLHDQELKLPPKSVLVGAVEQEKSVYVEGFDAHAYFVELCTSQFGRNWSAFPLGTVCVADVQYQGKGRAGNVWDSPKGCLMFSFTLQMEDGRTLPFLQYVVSLAIIEAIEAYCSKQELPPLDVRIKWPNDLYAKGLKVGGILCTSTYSSKKFNIVAGVGLNVSNKEPTICLEDLLERMNAKPHVIKREQLLAIIFSKFEQLLRCFTSQGFSALESSYYKRWLHSGQEIELEEKREKSPSLLKIPVTIQGLTSTGFLLATDEQNEKYELHPDGNSFDFLKGLVRKKVSP